MRNNLPDIHSGRILSRNISKSKCLKGNIPTDSGNMGLLINNKSDTFAKVIVYEIPSLMYLGVTKRDGLIYPTDEEGWDARLMRTGSIGLLRIWTEYVSDNYDFFNTIVGEGEFFLFSYLPNLQSDNNVIQRQSLYLLERYYKDGFKYGIESRMDSCKRYEFKTPPVLSYGPAISHQDILKQYKCSLIRSNLRLDSLLYDYEIDNYVKFSSKLILH